MQSTRALADSGLASIQGLSVFCNGIEVGRDGITEANIYFWNSGDVAVLQADVLEPYTISFPGRVLALTIQKLSRNVIGLQTSINDPNAPKVLGIGFTVLKEAALAISSW